MKLDLLLIILSLVIIKNLEILELIRILLRANNSDVITQLLTQSTPPQPYLLLQELLCKVLQVPLGKRRPRRSSNRNVIPTSLDHDGSAQVPGSTTDLDTIMEELFKLSDVKDTLVCSGSTVKDVLYWGFLSLFLGSVSYRG
jgi:hypothetical protein